MPVNMQATAQYLFLTSTFRLFFLHTLISPKQFHPLLHQNNICHSHACYMSHLSHHTIFNHPHNILQEVYIVKHSAPPHTHTHTHTHIYIYTYTFTHTVSYVISESSTRRQRGRNVRRTSTHDTVWSQKLNNPLNRENENCGQVRSSS
jgi:hypothetical protein